jgi:hypothetical protein
MARILSLILLAALAGPADEALTAYRELGRHIAEARRSLAASPDRQSVLTNLNIERDDIEARHPFRPGEPPALTAERRRADVEIRALTRGATRPKSPAKKPKKAKRG